MDKAKPEEQPRERYRHLPPRITQDQMIPLQAVVRVRDDVQQCPDDEWHIRMGAVA
jgi:hypothetical protein